MQLLGLLELNKNNRDQYENDHLGVWVNLLNRMSKKCMSSIQFFVTFNVRLVCVENLVYKYIGKIEYD